MPDTPRGSAARSMRPYVRRYYVSEWGWHLSWDGTGPVVQVNLGRTGITVPIPEKEDRRVRCKRCDREIPETDMKWKCCPAHTGMYDSAVMCEPCAKELHGESL